jgi:plastocyanin
MATERMIPGARSGEARGVAAVAFDARSTAMWLMPIAAIVEALLTIDTMLILGFLAPFAVITVVLLAIAVLAFARPRPRVLLTGGILLLAYTAMVLPFADGLIHPVGSSHAWTDIIAIVVGLAGAIAGFAAFVELRRSHPPVPAFNSPIGEALAILIVGVLIGTSYVSISGFGTLEATPGLGVTNGVLRAPTQPPIELDALGTAFTQKTLQLRTGPGTIYVVNTDAVPHTFDIEIDGRHVSYPVPSRSTTAVVLNLASAGRYEYWCAIPGHRPTMEGTLGVAES